MNSPFPTLSPAPRWAFLTLLAGFFGCTSAGVPRPPVLSDNLPTGVERDASQFRRQLARFYGKPTHQRTRRAICHNGTLGCGVEIEIQVDGVQLPDPAVPPAAGYAIARLTNLDRRDTEEYYHLVPSSRAEYFVWIDAMPGMRRTRWTLLYVPAGSGNVQTAFTKALVRCHAGDGKPYPVNVDFTEFKWHPPGTVCGETTYSVAPRSVSLASVFSVPPLAALIRRVSALVSGGATRPNGIWFECNGCCT